MNKKKQIAFVCNECGQDYTKWHGKCDNCGSWDTIQEIRIPSSVAVPSSRKNANSAGDRFSGIRKLDECMGDSAQRYKSGSSEIDRVLGGGFVRGACILLGGDPGIGKSTLLLQLAAQVNKAGISVMYISGEESAEQVALRANRLSINNTTINLLTETSVETILNHLVEQKPALVIVDSIQTVFTENIQSAPGSVAQVRESAALLLRFAKESGATMVFIGHVTKDGALAGPRILEHMVDTVLYFEGDSGNQYRVLRAVKNRFGPSGEIALLAMSDGGLNEITNASEFFLTNRHQPQTGTAITPILEGSRILMVELQSLVNKSHFGLPQRVASGIQQRKLSLLLAVLERHAGLLFGDHDVFFNIAGGLNVAEPAIDIGIAAALISSFRNLPIRGNIAFIGEIGLGGETRPVNSMDARLKELARMGFTECIVPKPSRKAEWFTDNYGLRLTPCEKTGRIQELLF